MQLIVAAAASVVWSNYIRLRPEKDISVLRGRAFWVGLRLWDFQNPKPKYGSGC